MTRAEWVEVTGGLMQAVANEEFVISALGVERCYAEGWREDEPLPAWWDFLATQLEENE